MTKSQTGINTTVVCWQYSSLKNMLHFNQRLMKQKCHIFPIQIFVHLPFSTLEFDPSILWDPRLRILVQRKLKKVFEWKAIHCEGNNIYDCIQCFFSFISNIFTMFSYTSLQMLITLIIFSCLVSKSCLTLCNPLDCSPPGSSVGGILQARILKWIAISLSRVSSSNPAVEPSSPSLQADSLSLYHRGSPNYININYFSP